MAAEKHPADNPQNGIRGKRDSKKFVEAGHRPGADNEPVQQRTAQANEDKRTDDLETCFANVAVKPSTKDSPRHKTGDAQNRESGDAPTERCAETGNLRRLATKLHAFGNALRIESKPAHLISSVWVG